MGAALKITPIDPGVDLLASDLVRSPGVHMSDIYGSLYRELEPDRYDYDDKDAGKPLIALGTAWERHLEFLLDKSGVRVMRPGEFVHPGTGLAYSPDGIIEEDTERLAEYKLSSMGTKELPTEEARNFPPKFDKYVCQMQAYCYCLEIPRARLYFLSIRRPYAPELLAWDVEFTAQELRENWAALMNHAHARKLLPKEAA